MTRLPSTYIEAQALAVARDWIAWHCESPDGIFHPNAAAVYGTSLMKRFAQSHPFGADDVVYFAEHGSKEADLALRELIAEYTDRGEPLTAVLRAYNIRLINPSNRPRKHGAGRAENFIRDAGIWFLVEALIIKCDLRPTQRTNRKTKLHPQSACSIAAAALSEAKINIPIGSKAVEKIWGRYLPAFAGERIAAGTKFAAGRPPGYAGLFGK
jgi:hypothetical protein